MDGFIDVFKKDGTTYGLSEGGFWYKTGERFKICVAGLVDDRSKADTVKLIDLMDGAEFLIDITDGEFRRLFEGRGTIRDKSAILFEQIKGRCHDV
jgi:hypothetical protein